VKPIDRFYYTVFREDEDARVCTDIPEGACTNVPSNFVRIVSAETATSLADELANPKTVLPWLLSGMGADPFWTGLIVPIRESMSLLPQLFVAGRIRQLARRKYAWMVGSLIQAFALASIAAFGVFLRGGWTGGVVVAALFVYSLARGLSSVSSKDVVGKTIPKTRRGRLTGTKSSVSGALTVAVGVAIAGALSGETAPARIAVLVAAAAALWLIAVGIFAFVREEPGATEGGANAVREAIARLKILRTDRAFRRFVLTRALFVSTALAGPYYVLLAREYGEGGLLLGSFIVASGLASAASSLVWGAFADRSSRTVLVVAAALASLLGVAMFVLDRGGALAALPWLAPAAYFLLAIAHSGVRIGRKTYVLDLAGGQKRTDYVAVANTLIGIVLLVGSLVGALTSAIGASGVLLVLAGFGFLGVILGMSLPEVE